MEAEELADLLLDQSKMFSRDESVYCCAGTDSKRRAWTSSLGTVCATLGTTVHGAILANFDSSDSCSWPKPLVKGRSVQKANATQPGKRGESISSHSISNAG
jgi:hypothetical protein